MSFEADDLQRAEAAKQAEVMKEIPLSVSGPVAVVATVVAVR